MRRVSVKAISCVLVTAAFVWVFSAIGAAGQAVQVTTGVYSAPQAARGQALYVKECAACHGNKLEGSVGSPLAGPDFLAGWSGKPLSDLVDKIQKNMPFNTPGSMSRQQSIDLVAYMLQFGQFPAGRADLAEGALAGTVLPTVRAAAAAPAAGSSATSLPPPVGNLAEFMRSIAFFNANIIFNLPLKNPGTAPKIPLPVPFDYVQWGYTIYPGWLAVDQAAVALSESSPLLLSPGRKCQNGKPAPVDRADFRQYTDALVQVSHKIYAASRARNYDALLTLADDLNTTCANCHKVYRDNGGPEGSGGNRCVTTGP